MPTGHTDTPRNLILDPNHPDGERPITSRTFGASQSVGQWVCKYGVSTGYNCGILQSKTFNPVGCVPNSTASYHLVHRDGVTLALGGDSGGPVFYGNSAYGLMNCEGNGDMTYVPIDRIESALNLTVLTWN